MAALISAAPALSPKNVDQIAALPLGSRVQVNAWDGTVAFTTRKAVPLVDASEKMPFRVTPVIPYLRVYEQNSGTEAAAEEVARLGNCSQPPHGSGAARPRRSRAEIAATMDKLFSHAKCFEDDVEDVVGIGGAGDEVERA